MTCPLCERVGAPMEAHHLKTRRKDRHDTEMICRECHRGLHGLYPNSDLRDSARGLDTVEGILSDERFLKLRKHIQKVPPGTQMRMNDSKDKKRRRRR